MDYTFAELLSREELINIFTERQLNLPNMHEMPHCELIRVYRSFALPLARREVHRSTRNRPAGNTQTNKAVGNNDDYAMDIDECQNIQQSNKKNSRATIMSSESPLPCEKRSRDYKHLNPLTDEYLSIATKRIKIAWS